ncbi:hypothetical protein DPMN_094121 [Dreissena polymorpha]|uniref:Uncharacterized protein n=1 Tax=Dreissena polymorpha TaxID=45954 RepID=A0A9D4R1N2_DREPO|nr:hypothetical protein DPMN_094121 [Dreissena polymorpha]
MMAYRATPHSTTSLSPNVMAFGRNVVLPCELATGVAEKSAQTIEEYSLQQRMNIEKVHDIAREHLKKNIQHTERSIMTERLNSGTYQRNQQCGCTTRQEELAFVAN